MATLTGGRERPGFPWAGFAGLLLVVLGSWLALALIALGVYELLTWVWP